MIRQAGITDMKNRMNFRYFLKEGFSNIFLHGFMSFAAVSIIAACLLITGSVALISVNIDIKIKELQSESEIVIFLDEQKVSRQDAIDFQKELLSMDNVAEAEFVPNEKALDEYREALEEDASILEGFDRTNNPLRDGYRIRLKDIEKIDKTVADIQQLDKVAKIRVNEDTISMLVKIRKVFEVISLSLILALGGISLFIISNTVKLAMFARREEIAIMKMVGATNWFIRWPFIIEGFIMGLTGGLIAFFAQWGVYHELNNTIVNVIGVFEMVEFSIIRLQAFGIFAAVGTLIGVGGSILTIRKFLDV